MGIFDKFSKKQSSKKLGTPHENNLNPDDWLWQSFLLNEAKFSHQQKNVKRSSKNEPITLGYIIKELLDISTEDIGPMSVISRGEFGKIEKNEFIESKSDVLGYLPFNDMLHVNKDGETLPRTGLNTVLIISYRPANIVFNDTENRKDKSNLCTDNSIIMFLRGMGPFIHETAYMRVSVMIPNFTSPDDFRSSHSNNAPFTKSFILGYDIVPPGEKLTRYADIKKSIIEKSNRGEMLSADELTVLEGITYSKDLGSEFGYGRWLITENRFADALVSLMHVFDHLKKDVVTDFEKAHEIFEETCYSIGFCLNELEQYERAEYFLSLIQGAGKMKYYIEYINTLVNNCDPRALQIVENYIVEFNTGKRIVQSNEDSFFYDFLARRLAYLYSEYQMWDKARTLLEQMINSPACHDFAVDELRYIDHVTGKR